ncbi:MAG: AmmeMemoRadiSam system protein A [Thermodesulfovibrionales bacterium]|nr:AmmeMemoRadiSam system protein A [Thermodesulfovibrionales bacterium]
MHPYVELAKKAVEEYSINKKYLPKPKILPQEFQKRAGVFVCLKTFGNLRGCIGTIFPTKDNLYEEIIKNAISAATEDPRFEPIKIDELDKIEYSVDILSEPIRVKDYSELDHKKYGVIVQKGLRRGLLLPDIEGVNSVSEQVKIAKLKAGIAPDDNDVEIYKFTVQRYK